MKEFLAKNKWMGFVAVLAYALITAIYAAQIIVPTVKEYLPVVAQEADQFLPITIENGEITSPVDTVISKTYGSGANEAIVVLDTRVDEFETSALEKPGLYISKKYMYGVTPQKTEIRSFESMQVSHMVIDSEGIKTVTDYITKNIGKYLFGVVFIVLLLFSCVAILLYTILMHWIVAIWFKQPFSQTLFINSLTYVLISVLGIFTTFDLSTIVRFVAFIAVNVGVCSTLKDENKPAE